MINKIWAFFIIIGISFALITGGMDVVNEIIFESADTCFKMTLKIFPVMALWLGIMNIAKISGLLQKFSKFIEPLLGKLFPELPKGHESIGLIASNIVINMFGLGNAATPFGLKAMSSLQEVNVKKDTASRSMITFLVINTSGVTIIPTTVISLRMLYKSLNPTEIVSACMIVTVISLLLALIIDRVLAKRW